jgi:hypothetical protein
LFISTCNAFSSESDTSAEANQGALLVRLIGEADEAQTLGRTIRIAIHLGAATRTVSFAEHLKQELQMFTLLMFTYEKQPGVIQFVWDIVDKQVVFRVSEKNEKVQLNQSRQQHTEHLASWRMTD